ncbi:MAG: enoyl-CoA hydratase [Betaproteobacteria bacterium RIFCSPLOWO2_12_FULL_64_23]|nr:MAG: enoyl-CoA hydratase [Betaproteobacteria bacterium RIFCSPLOWO2_12_FULL_64_23]
MSNILSETKDGIARIEIDRPDKKNALTAAMYQAMADAIHAAEADAKVRVLLIHGKPGLFTAGNDLQDFLDHPPRDDQRPVFQFLYAISQAQKPIIAAVAGAAVGIGTTMLLHCDLVYAAPNARLQLPFVNLGLVPEAASSLLLPSLIGYQRAAELLLLGEPFSAQKARDIGLVTEVVPEDQLFDTAMAQAKKLAGKPAASLRLTKRLMKQGQAAAVAQRIKLESGHFAERLDSPEAKEAFSAFLEKRKPDFSRFD